MASAEKIEDWWPISGRKIARNTSVEATVIASSTSSRAVSRCRARSPTRRSRRSAAELLRIVVSAAKAPATLMPSTAR
jgi:hypothetical protein